MKKFWVVLLSLGLLVGIAATASAADATFSGSYYVTGWYSNNYNLADTDSYSGAAFWQRFRIMSNFKIADGLNLIGRFDANEKGWGSSAWRSATNPDDMNLSRPQTPASTAVRNGAKVQENIEWERGYMVFKTGVGQFDIGYQSSGKWGTDAFDDEKSRPRIRFQTAAGPVAIIFVYEKQYDSIWSNAAGTANLVDADNENYNLGVIYNFKGGAAGVLYQFADNRANRAVGARTKAHSFLPYLKATFGPVYVEGEMRYSMGKAAAYECTQAAGAGAGTCVLPADVDWNALGAYLKVQANLGPAYVGGAFLYTPGDDASDATKKTNFNNGSGNGSQDLDFGIYLGNDWLSTWRGQHNASANFTFDSSKYNSTFYSLYGGFNPSPKLNIQALFAMASLNKIRVNGSAAATNEPVAGTTNLNDNKSLGMEFDITASYKLYDNLTYMVGAAYFVTGDAFKGFGNGSALNKVGNDYLLLNKLTLSF